MNPPAINPTVNTNNTPKPAAKSQPAAISAKPAVVQPSNDNQQSNNKSQAAAPVQNNMNFTPKPLGVLNPPNPGDSSAALPVADPLGNPVRYAKRPSGSIFKFILGVGAVIGGVIFAKKRLTKIQDEAIKDCTKLMNYLFELINNPANPTFKSVSILFNEVLDTSGKTVSVKSLDNAARKEAIQNVLSIAKKFSNIENEEGLKPTIHIVLNENARSSAEELKKAMISGGSLDNFVKDVDKIELTLEPMGFLRRKISNQHPIQINVGSYTYCDKRESLFQQFLRVQGQKS